MSKTAPAIPFFGDAYLADTRHLSLEEHGAYLQLIMIAWRVDGCRLPDDDSRLARMLGVTAAKWRKLKPSVMAFWTLGNGFWTQGRLTKERDYVETRRQAQRDKASTKWESQPEDDGQSPARKRAARLAEARAKGKHTSEEWGQLVALTGEQCVKCHSRDGELVKDHILPIYRGGSDALSNLQPLCIRCNSSKSADDTDYRLSVCKDLFERLPNAYQTPTPPPPPSPTEVRKEVETSVSTAHRPSANPFPRPEWADPQHWADFKLNRKRKRATNSATAYAGFLRDIEKHATAEWPPGRLLEHAAAKGWASINNPEESNFNDQANRGSNRRLYGPRPDPTLEIVRAARAAQRQDDRDHGAPRAALPSSGFG